MNICYNINVITSYSIHYTKLYDICGSLDELIKEYENGLEMFTEEMNNKYYQVYKALNDE